MILILSRAKPMAIYVPASAQGCANSHAKISANARAIKRAYWRAFLSDHTKVNDMKLNFEHTDTFGGESNYSWIRRETIDAPETLSDRAIVRRAKAWAGLSGIRSRVEKFGDMIAIRPAGICHVVFVTFEE